MTKNSSSAIALAVTAMSLVLVACGSERAAGGGIVIPLEAEVGSSPGTVRLSPASGSRTRVEVRLTKGAPLPQPAHVHAGTCDELDPLPAYSLASVENGSSQTLLPISLDDLRSRKLVVNVHKSDAEMRTSVGCGEIR